MMTAIHFGSITLLRFPRDDDAFAGVLDRIVAEASDLQGVAPSYIQDRLRAVYPGAVVHAQDPLAGLGAAGVAWYVYRDGSPVSS
jgi:hypothetical protein